VPSSEFWRYMRAIMYQPTEVWLASLKDQRWLTDAFVLLDVSDSEEFRELPDGAYKLTVVNGPEPRDAPISFKVKDYFKSMNKRDWLSARPTMWSVIEDYNGKAMLWDTFDANDSVPALLGESTWRAIKRYRPDVLVCHSWRGNSVFRFSAPIHKGDCETTAEGEYLCACAPIPFAYAAGIKMPEDEQVTAEAILEAA
jgi:hypothetical protein